MLSLSMMFSLQLLAQPKPLIKGKLPISPKQKLVFNPEMSDEFNGIALNKKKWETSAPKDSYSNWKGRFPGLFQDSAVTVKNGKLRIKASLQKALFKGKIWTHQGGFVKSIKTARYGYYECKMKANKTFMSSTFWLNAPCNGTKQTELDIVETFGIGTKNPKTGKVEPGNVNFTKMMSSAVHKRVDCDDKKDDKAIRYAFLPDKAKTSDDFHVYGAFWKGPNEIIFYLDGVEVHRIKPPVGFDLEMHMHMVVETYNWNKPSLGKDGMYGKESDRTTLYEYVRSWKLENKPSKTQSTRLRHKNILVYPQPVLARAYIKGTYLGDKVVIYNSLMQVVYKGIIKKEGEALFLGHLKSGNYYLVVNSRREQTIRVIKK